MCKMRHETCKRGNGEGKARGVSCLFTGSKPRMGIFAPSILQLISPASFFCVKTMSYASLEIEMCTMVPEILFGSKLVTL
ncbi:hypothetical protein NC651_029330 [Populus alba x Populus x berolinensis]|nr:hypothetical protein NC651_029330 [Populus alba x Populus x berolinensis]